MCPLGYMQLFEVCYSISEVKQRLAWVNSDGCRRMRQKGYSSALKLPSFIKSVSAPKEHPNIIEKVYAKIKNFMTSIFFDCSVGLFILSYRYLNKW